MGQYFWMKMAIECTALNMILAFSLWETTQQEMSTVCPPFLALSWMKMTHFKRDEQCQTREWEQTLDHHSAESSYLNVFGMRNEWYFQMSLVCLLRPSHQPGPIIGWVWFMEKLRHNRVMARIMKWGMRFTAERLYCRLFLFEYGEGRRNTNNFYVLSKDENRAA